MYSSNATVLAIIQNFKVDTVTSSYQQKAFSEVKITKSTWMTKIPKWDIFLQHLTQTELKLCWKVLWKIRATGNLHGEGRGLYAFLHSVSINLDVSLTCKSTWIEGTDAVATWFQTFAIQAREVRNMLTGWAFFFIKLICPSSKFNLPIAQNCPPSKSSCPQKNRHHNY